MKEQEKREGPPWSDDLNVNLSNDALIEAGYEYVPCLDSWTYPGSGHYRDPMDPQAAQDHMEEIQPLLDHARKAGAAEERDQCCRDVCPRCQEGDASEFRSTGYYREKWVHTVWPQFECLASSIRARGEDAHRETLGMFDESDGIATPRGEA